MWYDILCWPGISTGDMKSPLLGSYLAMTQDDTLELETSMVDLHHGNTDDK